MYLKYTMLYTNLNLNVSQFKFTYEFFSVKGRDMVEVGEEAQKYTYWRNKKLFRFNNKLT